MDASQPSSEILVTRPRGKFPALVAIILMAACAGGAYPLAKRLLSTVGSESEAPAPIIASNLDFGEVDAEAAFRWSIHLQNTSDNTVQIDHFKTSCSCTAAERKSVTIQPGASADVEFTLNLFKANTTVGTGPTFPFAVYLSPSIQDEKMVGLAWTLRGKVRFGIQPGGTIVDFGREPAWGQPSPVRVLPFRAFEPLSTVSAIVDPACARVEIEIVPSKEATTPNEYRAKIVLAERVLGSAGSFTFPVTLRATTSVGRELAPVVVDVRGVTRGLVFVVDDHIELGACEIDAERSETIEFRSVSGGEVQFERLESPESPNFTCIPLLGLPSCICKVVLTPRELGPRVIESRAVCRDMKTGERVVVSFLTKYHGLPRSPEKK